MFGAAEPRLRPLDPAAADRLRELRTEVDERRLRTAVEECPHRGADDHRSTGPGRDRVAGEPHSVEGTLQLWTALPA